MCEDGRRVPRLLKALEGIVRGTWPSRSKRTKNNVEGRPSQNSAVEQRAGTLIPGRVKRRFSGLLGWLLATLERSAEIGRLWDGGCGSGNGKGPPPIGPEGGGRGTPTNLGCGHDDPVARAGARPGLVPVSLRGRGSSRRPGDPGYAGIGDPRRRLPRRGAPGVLAWFRAL